MKFMQPSTTRFVSKRANLFEQHEGEDEKRNFDR